MLSITMILISCAILYAKSDPMYLFDGGNYARTSVLTIKGLPTNLAHNRNGDELLFTLIDLDTLQDDNVQTKMDQYILKNGEVLKIDNVNGQAAVVDEQNNVVYIATDSGLSVLNETNKANYVSLRNQDITQLFKPKNKDVVYAVFYPDYDVNVIDLDKNEYRKVESIPCAYIVAVDTQDNVYYECDSKYVKVLLKGFQEPIEFVGLAKDSAKAFALDASDRVILAASDGLYRLTPDNVIPTKIMDLEYTPSGIVFAGDDIYISTRGIIYKYSKLN